MTLENFIEMYYETIASTILKICPGCDITEEDFEDWVMNVESLYLLALAVGTEI